MILPEHQQSSIGLRAVKGILLSYDYPRSLSYLIYYKNQIYRTGHVHFNEDLTSKDRKNNDLEREINILLQGVDTPLTPDAVRLQSNRTLIPYEFTNKIKDDNNNDTPIIENNIQRIVSSNSNNNTEHIEQSTSIIKDTVDDESDYSNMHMVCSPKKTH